MPITPQLAEQARLDIFRFVERIVEVMRVIIHGPPRYRDALLVNDDMVEPLRAAWVEFSADFDLRAAYRSIFELPDDTLQNCGLYGAQARAKQRLIDTRLAAFEQDITRKNLVMLIEAMDIYLGSITEAGGIAGGLKEIAEVLRHSVDQ